MIKLGTSDMAKAYVGSSEASKMYLGSDLVYSKKPEVLPYDAEIEYLQSNPHTYIDTGVAGNNNNLVITAKWMLDTWNSGYLYSNMYSTSVVMTRLYFSSTVGNILGGINTKGGSEVTVTGISTNTVYTTIVGRGYLTVNGTTTTKSAGTNTANSRNIVLFNRALDNLTEGDLGAKLYLFKIEASGNTLLDMIPVRVGQVGYMYDKVSGNLFGNGGTGSFTLGPDVII